MSRTDIENTSVNTSTKITNIDPNTSSSIITFDSLENISNVMTHSLSVENDLSKDNETLVTEYANLYKYIFNLIENLSYCN